MIDNCDLSDLTSELLESITDSDDDDTDPLQPDEEFDALHHPSDSVV